MKTCGDNGGPQSIAWAVRLAALTTALVVCCLPPAKAATTSGPSKVVVIGQGIGGAHLGDSVAQVKRELGKPSGATNPKSQLQLEWLYQGRKNWLTVLYHDDARVTGMSVMIKRGYRTNKGIGMGSSLAEVRQAYPSAICGKSLDGTTWTGPPYCRITTRYHEREVDTVFTEIDPPHGVALISVEWATEDLLYREGRQWWLEDGFGLLPHLQGRP